MRAGEVVPVPKAPLRLVGRKRRVLHLASVVCLDVAVVVCLIVLVRVGIGTVRPWLVAMSQRRVRVVRHAVALRGVGWYARLDVPYDCDWNHGVCVPACTDRSVAVWICRCDCRRCQVLTASL